jgi:hypothetical protein
MNLGAVINRKLCGFAPSLADSLLSVIVVSCRFQSARSVIEMRSTQPAFCETETWSQIRVKQHGNET